MQYDNVIYYKTAPVQIIIKFQYCTFLLFSSGKCRFMGKANFDIISNLLNDIINTLDTSIITYPIIKSQTVSFSLNRQVNLHKQNIPHSLYEPELFPAVSIYKFSPLHVNLFSTGKVIILGCNALNEKHVIENWLNSILV